MTNTTINTTTNKSAVNTLTSNLRKTDKDLALMVRKVFGNLNTKTFTKIPTDGVELSKSYNGKENSFSVLKACNKLIEVLEFTEIENTKIEETTMDITKMTNAELLDYISGLLTDEENKTVSNLTIGLHVKLVELDKVKTALLNSNPMIAKEVLEDKLANALALTKEISGSALALDDDGKLALMHNFLSDKEVKHENYIFMASLEIKDRDLEVMLIQATFKKIIELSAKTFDNLTPALVLEIKKRISGIKSIEESDNDKLTIRI